VSTRGRPTHPGTNELITSPTGYVVSSNTGIVHRLDCRTLHGEVWVTVWHPNLPGEYETACRVCLRGGLPTPGT